MTTVWAVDVDVALKRPPRTDATRRVLVSWDASDPHGAALLAIAIASGHPDVSMPVGHRVTGWDL